MVLFTNEILGKMEPVDTFYLCTLDCDELLGSLIFPEVCLKCKICSVHHDLFVPGRSGVGPTSSYCPRTPRSTTECNHVAVIGECILLKLLHLVHIYMISNQTASKL